MLQNLTRNVIIVYEYIINILRSCKIPNFNKNILEIAKLVKTNYKDRSPRILPPNSNEMP